jgi:hypothetical protein
MLQITPLNNTIEFKLQVENASIKDTSTRLIIELKDDNLIVPLSIDKYGNCKGIIPLNENWDGKKGNIKIEVITEGNYFQPFEKNVIFEGLNTKPKATINEVTFKNHPLTTLKVNPFVALMEKHQNKISNRKKEKELKSVLKEEKEKNKQDVKILNEMKLFFSTPKPPKPKIERDIIKEANNFFKSK